MTSTICRARCSHDAARAASCADVDQARRSSSGASATRRMAAAIASGSSPMTTPASASGYDARLLRAVGHEQRAAVRQVVEQLDRQREVVVRGSADAGSPWRGPREAARGSRRPRRGARAATPGAAGSVPGPGGRRRRARDPGPISGRCPPRRSADRRHAPASRASPTYRMRFAVGLRGTSTAVARRAEGGPDRHPGPSTASARPAVGKARRLETARIARSAGRNAAAPSRRLSVSRG